MGSLTLYASGSPTLTVVGAPSLSLSNTAGSAISAISPSGGAAILNGSVPSKSPRAASTWIAAEPVDRHADRRWRQPHRG